MKRLLSDAYPRALNVHFMKKRIDLFEFFRRMTLLVVRLEGMER